MSENSTTPNAPEMNEHSKRKFQKSVKSARVSSLLGKAGGITSLIGGGLTFFEPLVGFSLMMIGGTIGVGAGLVAKKGRNQLNDSYENLFFDHEVSVE